MSTNMKNCPHCGAMVNAGARFCISCGQLMSDSPDDSIAGSLALEQNMPVAATPSGAEEGAEGGIMSASIGSTPPEALSDVSMESGPGNMESEETLSAPAVAPISAIPAVSMDKSAMGEAGSEDTAIFTPKSASDSTTYFAPPLGMSGISSSSDSLGSGTSAEAGQFQTPSDEPVKDTTTNTESERSGSETALAGDDSWYNSLSSSPGESVSNDTVLISPIGGDIPLGNPTVNIGTPGGATGNTEKTGYAPPPSYMPPPVSPGSTTAFTPPPAFDSSPIQPPQGQPAFMPPPQQGQSSYSPPPQQAQGQPVYTPPTQYGQPPPMTQMQGYGNYPPTYPGYAAQPAATRKDPTIALLLELIGYAGVLGIGHIYAGRTNRGIALLAGWLVYIIAASILTFVCIGCVMFIVWPFVPILSGLWIKNDLDKERMLGMQQQ